MEIISWHTRDMLYVIPKYCLKKTCMRLFSVIRWLSVGPTYPVVTHAFQHLRTTGRAVCSYVYCILYRDRARQSETERDRARQRQQNDRDRECNKHFNEPKQVWSFNESDPHEKWFREMHFRYFMGISRTRLGRRPFIIFNDVSLFFEMPACLLGNTDRRHILYLVWNADFSVLCQQCSAMLILAHPCVPV